MALGWPDVFFAMRQAGRRDGGGGGLGAASLGEFHPRRRMISGSLAPCRPKREGGVRLSGWGT